MPTPPNVSTNLKHRYFKNHLLYYIVYLCTLQTSTAYDLQRRSVIKKHLSLCREQNAAPRDTQTVFKEITFQITLSTSDRVITGCFGNYITSPAAIH